MLKQFKRLFKKRDPKMGKNEQPKMQESFKDEAFIKELKKRLQAVLPKGDWTYSSGMALVYLRDLETKNDNLLGGPYIPMIVVCNNETHELKFFSYYLLFPEFKKDN